jgi:hypothetical protein
MHMKRSDRTYQPVSNVRSGPRVRDIASALASRMTGVARVVLLLWGSFYRRAALCVI